MKKLKLTPLLLTMLIWPALSQADEIFKNFSPGRFDTDLKANYFNSTSNFGANGSKIDLPSGYSFQVIDTSVVTRFVFFKDFGLYAGANFGAAQSVDAVTTRKNSSLNSIMGGADYLVYKNQNFSFYVDLLYNHAVETIVYNSDTVLNNDGASEVRSQITGILNYDQVYPYAQIGVNYRMEGLSTLLTYSGGVEVKLESFAFGGGLVGYTTVADDQKTDQSYIRDAYVNRVDAFSKKYNSINPNYLDSDIYMKYIWNENWNFKINGGYSVMGSNAANGYHVGLAMQWGFGGYDPKVYSQPKKYNTRPNVNNEEESFYHTAEPVPPRSNTTQPSVSPPAPTSPKFQEDTNDGVNQEYFKTLHPSQIPLKKAPVDPSSPKLNRRQSVDSPTTNEQGYKIKLKKKKKKPNSN